MSLENPIYKVGGTVLDIVPSAYKITYSDVSESSAGRTEDTLMHKKKIGQKVKLELTFTGLTSAEAHTLLNMFDPEYISVEYLDPKNGTSPNYRRTATFYVGDRSSPLYNAELDIWESVAFNIIEQ